MTINGRLPKRSTYTLAIRLPGKWVTEYKPIINPINDGAAPSDMAKGVKIGYWACKSKKAMNRNR